MLSHHIFLLVFRISKDVNDTLHYNFDAMRFMSYSIFFTLKLIYFFMIIKKNISKNATFHIKIECINYQKLYFNIY